MNENLTGIQVVFHLDNPEKRAEHLFDHDKETLKGGAIEIMHLLQEILKFRLNFTPAEEMKLSSECNQTENDVHHVLCYPPAESLSNSSVMLFPTFQSRLSVLYLRSNLPKEKDLFVRNVTGNVWFYLTGTLVLLALCFRLSTYIHHCLKPRHGDWSWQEVVQWSLGAICQQGSERHPQGCSCRTMFLIGYAITYMIYTGYAAGITSLLAIRYDADSLPWHRVLHAGLPLIAVCNSQAHKYLKSKVSYSDELIYLGCVDTMEDLIAKAEEKSVGVLSENSLTHYMTDSVSEELRCEMSTSTQDRYQYYNGFTVRKNSPLRQPFSYWLLRFKESGLLQRTQRKWLKPAPACQMPPQYTQVGYEHVESAFLIIQICLGMALLIAGLEILMKKHRKKFVINVSTVKRRLY